MKTLTETQQALLDKWIVVRFEDSEDSIRVTRRENFENMRLCDAFGQYGRVCGCHDAACYALDNSDSTCMNDLKEAIREKFSFMKSFTFDIDCVGNHLIINFVDEDQFETEDDIPDTTEVIAFAEDWKKQNEVHVEVKGWTYHDSHNFKTVVLETEIGEPDCIELTEDEQVKTLSQMPETAPHMEGVSISEESEDYIFHFDRWATNPWFCYVEEK